MGNPYQSYETSPAIWDRKLPVTRHKSTLSA